MPSAIILAAGSSTRLGQPKQGIRIANETLLERSVRIADLAGLAPILLIVSPILASTLGARSLDTPNGWDSVTDNPAAASKAHVEILINHEAAEGIAASIRLGIGAAIKAATTGAVVLTCDQVAITPEHLRALTQCEREIRASSYAGRNGVPAYFPASCFAGLLQLSGDTGARDLLRHAVALPLFDGDLDIDTPADLARASRLYPDIAGR